MKQLMDILRQCGVRHQAILTQKDVVFHPVFREMCESNSCGYYGKCYMCPPDIGPIEQLIESARQYPLCLMYQNIYEIEDSFDFEGMLEAKKAHHQCAQRIHEALKAHLNVPFLHLEAGGCGICERCAKRDQLPCRFPERAIPSLESYGVDVYNTAAHAGLRYVNGQNTITYFGMLLLQEEPNG